MAIYVDPLMRHGWRMYGRQIMSCHLFTDGLDVAELHLLAGVIGLRRAWYQAKASTPHYDLTPSRREAAIAAGAIAVDRRQAVEIWRTRRALVPPFACLGEGLTMRCPTQCADCARLPR